jgi:hypothetical protein
LVYTPQPGQLHPVIFAVDAFADLPRAQKRACGGASFNWLSLKVGQVPQNFLQISMFSALSSTFTMLFSPDRTIADKYKKTCVAENQRGFPYPH